MQNAFPPDSRCRRRFVSALCCGLWLLFPLCAGAQTNLLSNPGFETGNITGWSGSYGNYAVTPSAPYAGSYCARVGYGSAVQQLVGGLLPNTTYTCTAWVKVSVAGQVAYLGVQNHGKSQTVSKSTNAAGYTRLTVTFTTSAPNPSTATVFVYHSGTGFAFGDDLTLAPTYGDITGTEAKRLADCLQRFGVNTFSKLNYNGYPWSWGGSQGNYDSATTARAINYIAGGTGLTINIREYHRDFAGGNPVTPYQKTWIREVFAATGSPFSLAIGANGGAADIPGIVALVQDSTSSGLNYVKWVEGINEPNTDFGYGVTEASVTASVQASLFQQVRAASPAVKIAGPSIVFGLPYPEGWLNNYLGAYKQTVLDSSDLNNIHVYPPKSPNASDGSNRGGALADIDGGFRAALPGKPGLNTEWHPTLYSVIHKNDPTYDAYWGPIYLLSSYLDFNWEANFWFALFDYNSAWMKCGLFATSDANPYPVANVMRALYQLTGDRGSDKLTFTPQKLNVTVAGLPGAPSGSSYAGGRWALFQNSSKTYFLFLWNEQNAISTATVPVTVTFNSHAMAKVEEFNITSGSQTALRTLYNAGNITVNLDTSLRLLRITY